MIRGVRELLWALAALGIAVLLAYGLVLLTPHEAQSEQRGTYETDVSPYVSDPSPHDAHLTALDREALDEAYRKYRIGLFEGWLKDPTQQPKRAIFGAEKARAVYLRVITEIDKRPVK